MTKFSRGDRVEYNVSSLHNIPWRANGTIGRIQHDTEEGDETVGVRFAGERRVSYPFIHHLTKVPEISLEERGELDEKEVTVPSVNLYTRGAWVLL